MPTHSCPQCGHESPYKAEHAGRSARCPECNELMKLPSTEKSIPDETIEPTTTRRQPRRYSFIKLAVTLILLIQAWATFRSTSRRWEYKIASPSDATFESQMDRLGDEGWEVVYARRARDGEMGLFQYEVLLKRPR